jgi:hypothetical protein
MSNFLGHCPGFALLAVGVVQFLQQSPGMRPVNHSTDANSKIVRLQPFSNYQMPVIPHGQYLLLHAQLIFVRA